MKTIHKLLALALCLALLCGAVSATMRETGTSGLKLADEVTYTHTSWSNDQKEGQYLQEHTLTYTAGGAVRPMVVYGDTLYGRSPMNYAAKFLEDKNLVLVAGVNGSFFDMNNGIPYGLIVTEGILRSSGNISSIGFFADGKTVIGTPELKVTATIGGTEQEIFYNKALTRDNGIGLYSRDYDTATKSSLKSYNVVLQPLSGKAELTMTGTLSATVRAVQDKTASCDIPEDCFVLAIAEDSRYASALDTMKALKTGDVVQITTTCNAAWSAVQYALRRRRDARRKRRPRDGLQARHRREIPRAYRGRTQDRRYADSLHRRRIGYFRRPDAPAAGRTDVQARLRDRHQPRRRRLHSGGRRLSGLFHWRDRQQPFGRQAARLRELHLPHPHGHHGGPAAAAPSLSPLRDECPARRARHADCQGVRRELSGGRPAR